ncbi:hypothetical protein bas30_0112 [Escherichia phage TrudiRoth]|uniref:Uncharacterized protein n=5 Tax=Epseptimavirus TaxID=2732017 RepID=A0A5J6T9T0_9CAUD|nr:hypothetical protein HWC37_gp194 [Salmonella phage vB_SenS_SB13]QCQ65391.1 hypothetical protein CPT_Seabear_093 [Salmonella phage Seabear]QXV79704.1 hypothetical protein bas26_0109 [Escherichia phage GreteKellenberger]QXV80455.1 hypothetical protein bas28_0113 [Escherichia phage IrmaTschudi]QXV84650.1 hypothetical protein bas29_0105 [Escherichia phage SuperGirl]QXV85340.1 hypothetical protein bas30_0112 [Escherichia phage TrudiRoth]
MYQTSEQRDVLQRPKVRGGLLDSKEQALIIILAWWRGDTSLPRVEARSIRVKEWFS